MGTAGSPGWWVFFFFFHIRPAWMFGEKNVEFSSWNMLDVRRKVLDFRREKLDFRGES